MFRTLSLSLSLAFGCNRLPEKSLEIQSGLQGKGYLDLTEEVTWNQWSGGMIGGQWRWPRSFQKMMIVVLTGMILISKRRSHRKSPDFWNTWVVGFAFVWWGRAAQQEMQIYYCIILQIVCFRGYRVSRECGMLGWMLPGMVPYFTKLVVVSTWVYFHTYWGTIPILTSMFYK